MSRYPKVLTLTGPIFAVTEHDFWKRNPDHGCAYPFFIFYWILFPENAPRSCQEGLRPQYKKEATVSFDSPDDCTGRPLKYR